MVFNSSYYKILDVPYDSSFDEIKSAFRKLSKVHHPDKNDNSPESNAKFVFILNAYSILVDPAKGKNTTPISKAVVFLIRGKKLLQIQKMHYLRDMPGFTGRMKHFSIISIFCFGK
jgi:hypothetical protein